MTTATTSPRMPALTLLLARYVTGEIGEPQFLGLSNLFDEAGASAEERSAFARFYLDALDAEGAVSLPPAEELADFLALARA